MDRWYRRAAVVVWPRNRAFEARAEAGSQWALRELRERIKTGDLADARAAAKSLAPFWNAIGARADLLGAVLDVAAGLGVAETAAMLLEPFRVEMLAPEHAGGLAAVAGRYGQDWTRGVFGGWVSSGRRYGTGLSEWINDRLPGLCRALRAAGRPETARMLAAGAWDWMDDQLRLWTTTARSDVRGPQLETLASSLVCLLEVADDPLRDEITGALREYEETVLECLMPALRLADARQVSGLDAVAQDCAQRLDAIVARPPRDKDDWSIAWTGCGCDLCDTLEAFLGSRSRRVLEWPLAKDGRRHVHTRIDSAGLSVQHQTRRQGRPYTLVLTKTDALFTRATDARRSAVTDLAWLTTTRAKTSART
jgi:hypothetical protein